MCPPPCQVYESVKKGGELSPAEMEIFDSEGGEYLLYELRFLSIKQRSQAAKYIAQNELSPQVRLAGAGRCGLVGVGWRGSAWEDPRAALHPARHVGVRLLDMHWHRATEQMSWYPGEPSKCRLL